MGLNRHEEAGRVSFLSMLIALAIASPCLLLWGFFPRGTEHLFHMVGFPNEAATFAAIFLESVSPVLPLLLVFESLRRCSQAHRRVWRFTILQMAAGLVLQPTLLHLMIPDINDGTAIETATISMVNADDATAAAALHAAQQQSALVHGVRQVAYIHVLFYAITSCVAALIVYSDKELRRSWRATTLGPAWRRPHATARALA